MGDKDREPFQLSFNGFLKVDSQGSRVISDGGLLLVRELDERLGLGQLIDKHLSDTRQGENKKFPLADLVWHPVYSRLAGYEDLNDAVRVSADPTFLRLGSKQNWDRGAALTSRLQLAVLAYNLGDPWRRLGMPRGIKSWSLTSWEQRLMKIGGRLGKHLRYYWLLLVEGHLIRRSFAEMLNRLAALPAQGG